MGDSLGLARGIVEVVASRAEWPARYTVLECRLRKLLGSAVLIEHVGSTSVPGLAAKPILDVAVLMTRDMTVEQIIGVLGAEFEYRGDSGSEGGLLFVEQSAPGVRTAHIHVVNHGDPQWERYLRVRDRLRSDPVAREAYARLKTELAARFPDDRAAYTEAKDSYIRTLYA